MAKTYRKSHATRLSDSLSRTLTRFGLGASYRHILTVQGRKTTAASTRRRSTFSNSMASGGSSRPMGRQAGSPTPAPRARSRSAAAGALGEIRGRGSCVDGRSPSASQLHH